MSMNLDKSLDEIISQNPSARRRGRGGRGGLKGARGATGGGVRKAATKPVVRAAAKPAASLDPTSRLDNDKIIISNLPADIDESSIKEYFAHEIGPVKKCSLAFNKNGKSIGVATMVFSKHGDASRAFKRFNGVPIDNGKKILSIELVVDPNRKTLADRIQAKPEVVAAAAAKSKRGKKGPAAAVPAAGAATRGGRKGRARRPKKTVEQLDAEMADYFVQSGSAPAAAGAAPAAAPAAAAPAVDMGDIPM
ncbi:hypothetical protein BZA70DRAFT_272920 [Myxozyma melibiosi]|uniref:RRM domain-containing protein n=1 Tax=Myxozyma melibiosi TaxID=54550 RepID=A0ABR1FE22_9ASCO